MDLAIVNLKIMREHLWVWRLSAKLKEIFGVKIVSKSPRTDAVWERLATDTTGELEPDVEFSTLARQLEYELYEAKERIKWLEEAFDAAEGLIAVSSCGCPYGDEVFHCSSCIQAINRYHKIKEAKP